MIRGGAKCLLLLLHLMRVVLDDKNLQIFFPRAGMIGMIRTAGFRSLLDSDAVVVAKKSFGPIVFIALQVEGARSKRVVLKWAVVVIPVGAIAYRLRRACAAGGGMAYQCGHKITGRWA